MRSPVQSWVALQERRAQLFTQLGFLFSAGVSLLTARRKQKRPRQSLEGSSLLGCFADHARITDQREVILGIDSNITLDTQRYLIRLYITRIFNQLSILNILDHTGPPFWRILGHRSGAYRATL